MLIVSTSKDKQLVEFDQREQNHGIAEENELDGSNMQCMDISCHRVITDVLCAESHMGANTVRLSY